MNLTDIFDIGRAGLAVYFKSTVSASNDSFRDGNPWIVMAENTGNFLISWRIGGNFTKIQIIMGIGRLQNHNAIPGIEVLFYRI